MWTLPYKPTIRNLFLFDYQYDADGIIYMQRRFIEGRKKVYVPVRVMQHALRFYNEWLLQHESSKKELFTKYAKWLLNHVTETEKAGFWLHNERMYLAGYRFDKPWIGCMDQGFGLSVLLRYYSVINDQKRKKRILEVMQKILTTFGTSVEKGGVRDETAGIWFEEFGASKRSHVLNGFIYALIGLFEYYRFLKSKEAKHYFDEGIATLRAYLPKFELDLGIMRWSRYDLGKIIFAGNNYHTKVHIPQLRILYDLTGELEFLDTAERWLSYVDRYKLQAKLLHYPLLTYQKVRGLLGV